MYYFLVLPDNKLQHLPDFELIPAEQPPVETVTSSSGTYARPTRKMPDEFTCTASFDKVPAPFLVMDEDGIVRRLIVATALPKLQGYVQEEFEASDKENALKVVHAAVAALTAPKDPAAGSDRAGR